MIIMGYDIEILNAMRRIKKDIYRLNPNVRKQTQIALHVPRIEISRMLKDHRLDYNGFTMMYQNVPEISKQADHNLDMALELCRDMAEKDQKFREQLKSLESSYPIISFGDMFGV